MDFTRRLGRSGIEVSPMGLGCWAIGGELWAGAQPKGWGRVDDAESIRALKRAAALGVTFFDTADVYGCGHSERLVGQALAGVRPHVIIATKFGMLFDETTRQTEGADGRPEYVRKACEASLRRLNTDYIDLYQFHANTYDPQGAVATRDALEQLVAEGKIRYYGWSTDYAERARVFAQGKHCVSIQHTLNLFERNDAVLAVCSAFGLASINRGPLAKGLLTGKFTRSSVIPQDDVRQIWNLRDGVEAEQLDKLQRLCGVLTRDGRSLTQAALGWLWAHHPNTIPIPGFKTVQQVEENIAAIQYGPLSAEQMQEIETLLQH
jgi:aryl-alcohol dehydrogenase-like predicted oxidoreductase